MPILLGAAVLILLLWAGSAFSKADPKQAARLVRYVGGGAALIAAAFLLLKGAIGVAQLWARWRDASGTFITAGPG